MCVPEHNLLPALIGFFNVAAISINLPPESLPASYTPPTRSSSTNTRSRCTPRTHFPHCNFTVVHNTSMDSMFWFFFLCYSKWTCCSG